jgi:hypothetical protein
MSTGSWSTIRSKSLWIFVCHVGWKFAPGIIGSWFIMSVLCRIFSFLIPVLLMTMIKLIFIPWVISLDIWLDITLLLMKMIIWSQVWFLTIHKFTHFLLN